MSGGNFLTRRDGVWHYARRVPVSVARLDKRGIVKQSTKVRIADDPRGSKAGKIAERINDQVEAYWRGLGEGQAAEAKARYEDARRRAKQFGFSYIQHAELIEKAPFPEVAARYATLKANESDETAAAILGGEAPPKIMLSGLFEEYERLTEAARRDMSPDQVRRWRNTRLRATKNLIAVIGDKAIDTISHADALAFHDWWSLRVIEEEMDVATANHDVGFVSKMLSVVDKRHRLGIGKAFAGMRLEGSTEKSRQAFTVPFVRDTLLAPGALAMINEEARDAIYLIAETGLRLSEAVNLLPARIMLNAEVPHVQIRPDGRRLKTPESWREVPLVGVALDAMKRRREGFPRYHDKAASFSAAVNKTLAENGLLEEGRTIYSLRHTFEDRLGEVDAPDKMIANLMGHKHDRPKYGSGPSLEMKQRWLQTIAFKPPSIV